VNRVPTVQAVLGDPSTVSMPRAILWLQRSKIAAIVWTAIRVWLGIMWIQAGVAKLWGAENGFFLHNGAPGVSGLASHGVPAYTWWGSFLHGFVVPNAGWIGVLVAVAEFAIGVALVLGLFTPIAALGSLLLLFTYVMSGVASVCALYALFAVVLLAMWPTAGWIGVDGLISGYWQNHVGSIHRRSHRTEVVPNLALTDVRGSEVTPEYSSVAFAPQSSPASLSDDVEVDQEHAPVTTTGRSEQRAAAAQAPAIVDDETLNAQSTLDGASAPELLSPL
jgi:thiosulfate dehydrogenase (quinone) large subunit